MTDQLHDDDEQFEDTLRRGYGALRTADAAQAPAFDALFARAATEARVDTRAGTHADTSASRPSPQTIPRWRSPRTLLWATPMLVAAAVAIMVLSPGRVAEREADREFEALVSEWTRTSAQASRLPTDGLLSLPGSEYLRTVPAIGGGGDASATRRPS